MSSPRTPEYEKDLKRLQHKFRVYREWNTSVSQVFQHNWHGIPDDASKDEQIPKRGHANLYLPPKMIRELGKQRKGNVAVRRGQPKPTMYDVHLDDLDDDDERRVIVQGNVDISDRLPELSPPEVSQWRYVRILGYGVYGIVVLVEKLTGLNPRLMAVKTDLKVGSGDTKDEAAFLKVKLPIPVLSNYC